LKDILPQFTLIWRTYGGQPIPFFKGDDFIVQTKITEIFVQKISTDEERLKVYDTILKGLVLFVRPTGKKTWFVDYRKPDGKRTNHCIGSAQLLSVNDAREMARDFLSAVAKGEDPTAPSEVLTFGAFVKSIYEPWILENRKAAKPTLYMLTSNFGFLNDTPLDQITIAQIEQWQSQRKKGGLKTSSINRRITALKAAINWASKRNIIEASPLAKFEKQREVDTVTRVRYLSKDERERLLTALDEREKEMRLVRDGHNEWAKTNNLPTTPSLSTDAFMDHLKPIILLSLSTGIRRDGVLSLVWSDVNFADRMITVRAASSKTEKEYRVPMNALAFEAMQRWRAQSKNTSPNSLVFPSPQTGKKMDNCNTSWRHLLKRAQIENFHWHDMRHDFASQLVMKGADLNSVRELLGHSDLKMTLRYAHLAPESKLQVVKLLD
jgi:site-specific recombinase XerD